MPTQVNDTMIPLGDDSITPGSGATLDPRIEEDTCLSTLLFAFEYPPVSGGISRLCEEIAANLVHNGIPVHVLTQGLSARLCDTPTTSETRIVSTRPFREWRAVQWLRRFTRHSPVDRRTTVCAIWYPEGLIAYLAGVRPRVVLAHGSELLPPESRWRRRAWEMLQRRVLEGADLVIANSIYTRELVRRVAPKANVQAIPLAVDAERFAPGDREAAREKLGVLGKRVLCTVARIHEYKGIDLVLQAIASLPVDERERIVYLIVGQGPREQELRKRAAALGIDPQVRWIGFVSERELPDIYRASDLFVLCTRHAPEQRAVEGFGLVFLEAQSCGVPVVGTNTGGIPSAIREGEGGWLIEQDDSAALAKFLSRLVHDPEFFRAAGLQARRRVLRDCTWKTYSQRFRSALQSLHMI